MYKLIYDYIGENDSCKGIEETFDTWQEANETMQDLKANPDYCNFSIVSIDF